jgi:hypothetical protein
MMEHRPKRTIAAGTTSEHNTKQDKIPPAESKGNKQIAERSKKRSKGAVKEPSPPERQTVNSFPVLKA